MKKSVLLLLTVLCTSLHALTAYADGLNLTPRPKSVTMNAGTWVMPATLTVGTGQLADSLAAEAQKFADVVSAATGRTVSVESTTTADITMEVNPDITNAEGYKVTVRNGGIKVEASTAAGFFYAFQTIKKVLPACVMAGVRDESVTDFSIPCCTIDDEPRFEYRGYMLDVSRHFFDVEQVKRMLDVMAYYKLNKFHWHLTDDQGWRIEIKKYPKLCTVGATRAFSYEVDPVFGRYQTYEPYGPYFYTQEEAKEVVEYAAKLHIEVIPEVDMPGHFVAAMAAYPEYSCTPNGSHSVWTDGGISSDVLNVANPQAVQFTKDILTELAEIFPSKHLHIGGDECPTNAWQSNAECQALYKELNLSNYRALQSHFIKQMDAHAKSLGKHLFMWNESISADGADQDIIQNTDATIMCWTNPQPAALTASGRGLKCVITPWGPYYINRVQSTDPGEPVGAGSGSDTAESTYNYVPVPTSVPANQQQYYIGVQGTFWCEHVGSRYLLEYLSLPRLICIAEAGWTPQNLKDWNDFKKRWNQDYKMLDYNGYYYGKHYIEAGDTSAESVQPKEGMDYRIVTTATDAARSGACIEVLPEGSDKIGTGNAKAYRLWQMPQASEGATNYDYQWFTFEPDPSGSGLFAMVCRALPAGSVNPTPTATNNTARFDYDRTTKHYAWTCAKHGTANGHHTFTLRSEQMPSGMYVNAAAGGQSYSVNQWSDPNDGNGGIWEFAPAVEEEVQAVEVEWPSAGSVVRVENAVKAGRMLCDDGTSNLKNTSSPLTANAWVIESLGTVSASGLQRTIRMKNASTGRYISSVSSPVSMGASGCDVTLTWNADSLNWNLSSMAPVMDNYSTNPGCLVTSSNSNSSTTITPIYPQGTAWNLVPVTPITINCVDSEGQAIGTYYSSLAEGEELSEDRLPEIKNHSLKELTSSESTYTAVYERSAYSVAMRCADSRGIILLEKELTVKVGETCAVEWPTSPFYTFVESETAEGSSLTPTDDMTLTATYSTEAVMGWSAAGEAVKEVSSNNAYLIRDIHSDAGRAGFMHTTPSGALFNIYGATEGDPSYVWTLTKSGSSYRIKNELGYSVPLLGHGSNTTATTGTGGSFTLTYNASSESWTITGSNGESMDANTGGGVAGWTGGGHPHAFHRLYGTPYYYVTVVEVTIDGNGSETSKTSVSTLVAGGSDQSLLALASEREGYSLTVDAPEGLSYVAANLTVTITYTSKADGIGGVKAESVSRSYDLSGRATAQKRGVVIRDSKKVAL